MLSKVKVVKPVSNSLEIMSGVLDREAPEISESKRQRRNDTYLDQVTADKESEGCVQDQLILAPEIMWKILKHLNLRALKTARLVCKSWLLEAQSHMERSGVVSLKGYITFTRFQNFMKMRKNKIQALPQPFMSLDVDLSLTCWRHRPEPLPPKRILKQLSSLCPPLGIRRFFTAGLPLKLFLPLLTQCSSSLEHLDFFVDDSEIEDLTVWMGQDLNFPKLRHIIVYASSSFGTDDARDWIGYPAIVARIMGASPNMDTYSTMSVSDEPESEEQGIAILLGADMSKVRTLQVKGLNFSSVTSELVSFLPFSQLQNLEMSFTARDGTPWNINALVGISRTAASTLRKLNLLHLSYEEFLNLAGSEFPVCPTVKELHLGLFNGWIDFISRCFPSLEVFKTQTSWRLDVADADNIYGEVSPFLNVKTLILLDRYSWRLGPLELFSLFPRLECLNVHEEFFFNYFEKMTSDNWKCLDLLKGLKHLELHGSNPEKLHPSPLLAELKGLETISLMGSNETITRLPLKELPRLKVIRFNWGGYRTMKKLLEIAGGVERVVVTNCCSFPRKTSNRRSKDHLEAFFAAAPNAECGCKEKSEILC